VIFFVDLMSDIAFIVLGWVFVINLMSDIAFIILVLVLVIAFCLS